MTIHIPTQLVRHGQDAIALAGQIARQTGGILVAGNRALTVRPARNARESATVVRLRRVLANSLANTPEAA
jgi:hypothetical protein